MDIKMMKGGSARVNIAANQPISQLAASCEKNREGSALSAMVLSFPTS